VSNFPFHRNFSIFDNYRKKKRLLEVTVVETTTRFNNMARLTLRWLIGSWLKLVQVSFMVLGLIAEDASQIEKPKVGAVIDIMMPSHHALKQCSFSLGAESSRHQGMPPRPASSMTLSSCLTLLHAADARLLLCAHTRQSSSRSSV
jgi:hypothetical protein